MAEGKKWIVVVEPMPPEAAKAQFVSWKAEHPEIGSRLKGQDLMLEVIRGGEGKTLHRYKIFVHENDGIA